MDEPRFAMVPGDDELRQVERLMGFHEVVNAAPQTLSRDEIGRFNQDGFLRPLTLCGPSEIDELRGYFDGLLAREIAAGGDSYSISTAHLKHGRVYDLLTDPRIVAYVRDLLGEDLIAWGSHFFCKMPGDGKQVTWHQDASYWPLTPTKAVTVWLAIDDADVENACMRFLAGSHRQGHIPFRRSSPDEHNVLNQTIENPEQYGHLVVNELKAGQISIHSDLLLHDSDANRSSRRRCGLTLRYCPADVRAELDWNLKGVVVSGSDKSGHWANPPRPE